MANPNNITAGKAVPGRVVIILWSAFFLVLAASASLARAEQSFTETSGKRMEAVLAESLPHLGLPGVVATVDGPRGRWSGAWGWSEIRSQPIVSPGDVTPERSVLGLEGRVMTVSHQFHVGSIRKTVTAAAILALVRDGLFGLDTPAGDLVSDLPTSIGRIPVRRLLNHSSGIPDYTDHPRFYPLLLRRPDHRWTAAELLDFALELEMSDAWRYSNTNYIVLGMVLDRLLPCGQATFMQERFFKPLGMKSTFLPEKRALPGTACRGYRYDFMDRRGRWTDVSEMTDPSFLEAAGAMVSNAGDLNKWLNAFHSGRLFPAPRPMDFAATGESGVSYGFGIKKTHGSLGHDGDYVFGYQALLRHVHGHTVVILTNGYPVRPGVIHGPSEIYEKLKPLIADR